MNTKVCSSCKQSKLISEFSRSGTLKNGDQRYKGWCKECYREYDKKYYSTPEGKLKRIENTQRQRESYDKAVRSKVFEYLKSHPCIDCGQTDILFLEFDHVKDKKISGIGKMLMRHRPLNIIMTEIEKCEVRCLYCHREKTAKQFKWSILNFR